MSYDEAAERLCYAAGMYEQAYKRATEECATDLDVEALDDARTQLRVQAERFARSVE